LRTRVPTVSVVGYKNSGKTTVVEALISELVKKGRRVASVKHVSKEGFSIDTEGSDSWRHSIAGANPVIIVSDVEMTIKTKMGMAGFSTKKISRLVSEHGAEVLILEGFSSFVLDDPWVGKIICVRNQREYDQFKKKTQRNIIAFCSFHKLPEPVLSINDGLATIVEKTSTFISEKEKIAEILDRLPGLDCRKCGRSSCEEMAEAIFAQEASFDDCVPLRSRSRLKTRITIDDVEVPIQPFVSEIIRKSVLGMVSTLKGVNIKGDERVSITIS